MTPEPPDLVPPPRPARRLFTAVLLAASLVLGLIALGHWTRADLDRRDYYAIPFSDIDCPTPPGRDRAAFLAEVQYLGGLPDRTFAAVHPAERDVESCPPDSGFQ